MYSPMVSVAPNRKDPVTAPVASFIAFIASSCSLMYCSTYR
jgi:hypothetical protein